MKENQNYQERRIRPALVIAVLLILLLVGRRVFAVETEATELDARMKIYEDFSFASGVPWYQIAAIDQYERNIDKFRKGPEAELDYEVISIKFSPALWSGPENPVTYDDNPYTTSHFGGIGQDGDGDGIADINNEEDVLFSLVDYLKGFDAFEAAIENYYQNEDAVRIVGQIARLFETYGTLDLGERAFPVSQWHNYSFTNGFGAARGWGGRRSHEGVDIFASYGTPVVATGYGVVEIMGWNDFGGYRIGIRDIYNTYQYYAHLQWFAEDLEVGSIVKPGQVIGAVGSTGYGPEGTSGKFVPHLHFGLYKFDGRREWAFDPYPYLVRWEAQ